MFGASQRMRIPWFRRAFSRPRHVLLLSICMFGAHCFCGLGVWGRRFPRHTAPTLREDAHAVVRHVGSSSAQIMDEEQDVREWSVRELRQFLDSRATRHDDCFEKRDLVQKALSIIRSGASPSSVGESPVPPPPQTKAPSTLPSSMPTPSGFSAFGEVAEVPAVGDEEACLVFFHGFGDSARGFVSQLPNLLQLPSVRYVLPTAKSLGGMNSWFESMAATTGQSIEYAHYLLRRELARGVSAERLFVGGFSQGGCVAVQASLSFPDARLGGCIAASTFLGGGGASGLTVAPTNQRLPVLVCHGDADPAVPLSSGTALHSALRGRGVPAEMRTYAGMGHAYCPAEANDVKQFLQRRILVAGGESGLRRLTAKQLKQLLVEFGASTTGCFDKQDLLDRARATIL